MSERGGGVSDREAGEGMGYFLKAGEEHMGIIVEIEAGSEDVCLNFL